ncbi:hypothetical protein scyTo_0023262, partial [Scyliorhinus torazame]|nr:hypothetical protein [Scyliorhinus torazame]
VSTVPYLDGHHYRYSGWKALIPSNETLSWYFERLDHITNISYTANFYHFKDNDYVLMLHHFPQSPNHFQILTPARNGSLQPLSWARNVNGDWYFDQDNLTLYYLVSGRGVPQQPNIISNLDPTMININVQFRVFRCFYQNCAPPPRATVTSGAPDYNVWSNSSFWELRSENNYSIPAEGDSVVIPKGKV